MNGAYVLSQRRNWPSHICDISTTDGCNFPSDTPHSSLSYFQPLTLFFLSHSLTQLLFLPTLALFWLSALGYLLSVPPASLFLFPHVLLFLRFIPFFPSLSFLLFVSHLIAIFLFRTLSLSSWTVSRFLFLPPHTPPLLTLSHLLNLSTCLYLCLLSTMTPAPHLGLFYLSLSVSPSSVFSCSLSLFVFPSATLLCLAPSRQGCWQRWARAYLKCHWQSDKRSYGK